MSLVLPPYVVLDTCVLISGILKPLFLRLYRQGMCRLIASEEIKHEWIRNAARIWGRDPGLLTQAWQEFEEQIPQLIESDLEPYMASLRYSDRKDFHVIAAALACKARRVTDPHQRVIVVTWNLKDFNKGELRRAGLELYSPDRLLSEWLSIDAEPLLFALEDVPLDVALIGKYPPEPLAATLKRERLYSLNKAIEVLSSTQSQAI